jgi:hypothetical protein
MSCLLPLAVAPFSDPGCFLTSAANLLLTAVVAFEFYARHHFARSYGTWFPHPHYTLSAHFPHGNNRLIRLIVGMRDCTMK